MAPTIIGPSITESRSHPKVSSSSLGRGKNYVEKRVPQGLAKPSKNLLTSEAYL